MAQVEFRSKRARLNRMQKNRLAAVVFDSSPKLTLQINRPQDVEMRWVARWIRYGYEEPGAFLSVH
ncbi:hypothetical protein BHYA_0037g00120 [Botrytis hyacinthi]|uniref:Uncharacterized protein n=1 Tax=Botrytis hyacinthi TaxID=278943 RepID=A0A4Z1H571_9HELO|nr:hypothetical protein BHYA_0037g00120 [Botrytis hyacinthi]